MAKVNSPSKLYVSMESKFVEAGYNDGVLQSSWNHLMWIFVLVLKPAI